MEPISEISEYALDRIAIGTGRYLEDLVIVLEL